MKEQVFRYTQQNDNILDRDKGRTTLTLRNPQDQEASAKRTIL